MKKIITSCYVLSLNKAKDFLFIAITLFITHLSAQNNTAALNFDGNDDLVEMGNVLNLGTNDFTVEAWFKTKSFQVGAGDNLRLLLIKGGSICSTPQHAGYSLFLHNRNGTNTLGFYVNNFNATTTNLLANTWYHVVGVRQGSTIKLYVNGNEVASTSTNTIQNTNNTDKFCLGTLERPVGTSCGANPPSYDGILDEVRVWNRALSATEIAANSFKTITGTEGGLLAYYNFEEGVPNGNNVGKTILKDLAGGDQNGTLKNFALTGNASNWVGTRDDIPTANLKLWLKADGGITTINGKVSQWNDQSNNNNNAVQSNAALQPTFVTNQLNGLPIIRFYSPNSTNFNRLDIAALDQSATQKVDVFIVYKINNNTNGTASIIIESSKDINTNQTGWVVSDNDDANPAVPYDVTRALHVGNTGLAEAYTQSQPLNGIYKLVNATLDKNLTSQEVAIRINKVFVPQTNPSNVNNTNSFGNNPVFIGARGDGNINKAIGLDGDIGEILVYNTVLDDANRKTVEDYLSKKWLPVDINNGLIAYYPLDGDETDKSPNKLDGAKQGTITYETGQQGKAARFNGSSSIKLSNVSGAYQKLSPSKISISLWAKYGQNDVSTTAGFILRNRTFGYEIAVNSTGLGGSFYVGTAGIGKSVANKFDAWRHIVITYDGTAMIFYLDGVPQEVIPATGNIYYGLNDAVMLGQDGTAGRFFKGLIDEVRIYDRAITEGEVKELYGQNLEKGLVAHYPFNGNAQDESGNNYHVQTNTATLTTDRFGKPNSAYRFNGTSNFMEVPHNTPFTTQNHTISAWIKTTKSSALGRIVVLPRPVGDQQFSLNVNSVRPKKACIYFDKAEGGGAVVAYNDKDVTDGEWHYLIGIIDQTNKKMSMYVDGILGDVINLVNTPVASTSFLQIGRFNAIQPENFDGDIDDIRIYDRAISQSEIEKLYGKPIDDINKGLIAHYPLNGDTKDVGPNKLDGEPKNIGNDDYVVGINGLKAAKFNGSSSAIILANITDASKYTLFSPKKFTLSAQFKDGTGTLIDWGYGGYELKVKKGTIANQIEIEGSVLVSGGRIRVNKAVKMHPFLFNHAALTFDGFNLILYFDGKPIGNIKMSNLIDLAYNPKDVVAIGKRENNNDFFKGLLQDVRFYDRALSDVEVNNLYYVPLEKRTVESIYPSICGKGDGISLTTAIKGKGFQQNQIVQLVSRDDNSKVINGIIKKITDNEIIVKWDIPETSKLGHYNLEVLNFSDGIKRTLNKAFEVQKLINDEPPFAALFGGELRCGVFTLTISNKSNVPIYAYNKGILVQALNEFSNIKVSSITRIEDFPRFSSNTLTKNQIEELNKLTTDFIVSEDKIEHKKNYALRLIIPKLNPLQKALQFRFKVTGGSPGEEYIAFKEENKHKIVDLNPSNLQNCSYCSQCYIDFGSFIPFVDRFACLGQAWCSVTNHIIAEDEAGNDTGFKNMGKQIQDGLWDCVSGEIIKEKVDKINNEYAKDIVTASEAVENIGNVVVDCDKCANSYVQYKNKVTVCSSTARQQVLGYEIADTSIINYNIVGNNGFKLEKYVKSGSPMPYIGNVQKSVSKNK